MLSFQSLFYCIACFCFMAIAFVYLKILSMLSRENNILKYPLVISLDAEDFGCLVRGGILKVGHFRYGRNSLVCLALRDIGFDHMEEKIESAINGKDIQKEHVKIIE